MCDASLVLNRSKMDYISLRSGRAYFHSNRNPGSIGIIGNIDSDETWTIIEVTDEKLLMFSDARGSYIQLGWIDFNDLFCICKTHVMKGLRKGSVTIVMGDL